MRGRVVHVGGQPHRIPDPGTLEERQQIGDLVFTPLRRAVTERHRVLADQADRQVRGNHLPGRVGSSELPLQPGELRRSEDERVAVVVALVPGRIAVAAHVDQKHVEQRPVSDLAIDASGLAGNGADRHEFEERAAGPRHQARGAVLVVAGLVDAADRRPVVGHFMIVPLREHRHLGVESAQVLVEQIVFIVAAKLVEVLGDLGFLGSHDVAPDFAVRQFQLGRDRTVGIDVIAGMDEEIGAVFQHGGVGAHAAAGRIDAPALARGIARPDKRNRIVLCGRGAEMADLGFARNAAAGVIQKAHPIKDVLRGQEVLQQHS
jgi:hypothetical protein